MTRSCLEASIHENGKIHTVSDKILFSKISKFSVNEPNVVKSGGEPGRPLHMITPLQPCVR